MVFKVRWNKCPLGKTCLCMLRFANRLTQNSSSAFRFKLVKLFLASGDGEIRTLDPLLARQVLSQLSYTPIKSGIHLLSHTVSSIVPSAAYVLTVVFGMGTGVSHKRIDTRIFSFPFRKCKIINYHSPESALCPCFPQPLHSRLFPAPTLLKTKQYIKPLLLLP